MKDNTFNGFSPKLVPFLAKLSRNNNRPWFQENKPLYEKVFKNAAQQFIIAMGERLEAISPDITADPKTNGSGSLFRIFRDVRFSNNKDPYKTHMGLYFWDGVKKKECPGFYVQISPEGLLFAAGLHEMPKGGLPVFREMVADNKTGEKLKKIIHQVTGHKGVAIGGEHYKRIPRGYPKDHPRADLLLHNALYAMVQEPVSDIITKPEFVEYTFERFFQMAPLFFWLVDMMKKLREKSV